MVVSQDWKVQSLNKIEDLYFCRKIERVQNISQDCWQEWLSQDWRKIGDDGGVTTYMAFHGPEAVNLNHSFLKYVSHERLLNKYESH